MNNLYVYVCVCDYECECECGLKIIVCFLIIPACFNFSWLFTKYNAQSANGFYITHMKHESFCTVNVKYEILFTKVIRVYSCLVMKCSLRKECFLYAPTKIKIIRGEDFI